jgi:riboflavin kinase/FMN adenylyltransferase
MAVFFQYEHLPVFRNPVITIGSFDGVHLGHRTILDQVVQCAQSIDGESILVTFDPHPRKIIHPDAHLGLLTSPEQKIRLLQAAGMHHILVVPFTRDFSMLSAEEYIHDFLINKLHPHTIIIGYDHRFGHSREGSIDMLKSQAPSEVEIVEIPPRLIDHAAISSTKIRKALTDGDVEDAAIMLGRPYAYQAIVVHGDKIGRSIGYPTANLQAIYSDILIPGIGIYAVMVKFEDRFYKGMMSIGYRPTVTDQRTITCEVNLLDFEKDIYGNRLEVYFIKRLRGEEKFDSLKALTSQIAQDEIATRAALEQVCFENLN